MTAGAKWIVVGTALLGLAGAADAARIGGGRSVGAQRPSINAPRATPQAAAPAAPSSTKPHEGPAADPVMPRSAPAAGNAGPGVAAAAGAAPARAAAAGGASRWLGPIAGIGAALGLATLLSHAGITPGFADLLTLALLAAGALLLMRMLLARRAGTAEAARRSTPAAPAPAESPFDARFGGAAPAAGQQQASHFPPGFDAERFARQATQQFRAVQRAYDHGDTALLADVMTPELYTETVRELRSRGLHIPTEFEAVDAKVVDVHTEADLYWVSVRFHGLSREDGARVAQPFDEVWNLSKPLDGSTGWLVAGVQQSIAA